jgi:hypothetical protein
VRYVYLIVLLVVAAGWALGLYWYASGKQERWKGLRVRDVLLVWPMIIDARRDETGDFRLRKAEVIGICVVIVLMIVGFVFTPHRGR